MNANFYMRIILWLLLNSLQDHIGSMSFGFATNIDSSSYDLELPPPGSESPVRKARDGDPEGEHEGESAFELWGCFAESRPRQMPS